MRSLAQDPSGVNNLASRLDSQNRYSADGIDLIDSYRPAHLITGSDGSTVNGRADTHTDYDTGSEPGHPARWPAAPAGAHCGGDGSGLGHPGRGRGGAGPGQHLRLRGRRRRQRLDPPEGAADHHRPGMGSGWYVPPA
jgi:hypothetical protein